MPIKYYSDQIDKLQEDLYRYNPNAFQQELENPEIDEGPSISSVLGNVGKGFVSGFTTLKTGEEADNTVDSIAYSIGHLLGFIGFVPGPGILGKIGFKALAKNAGLKGVERYFAKAAPGIQLKSAPMFVADKIMNGLGKFKALEPATQSIKFLQSPITKDVIQGAAHLGIASSVSSWQDGVSGMMDGFVGGATFGGFSRLLGNYVGAKGKLEFGKHQFPTDPKKAKLVDDSIKGLTGAIAMGMPSTLQGAPLEIQIYEYLLNGYFGFKEMPYYRRGALNEINKVNAPEKRFRLLDPSHEKNGIEGFKDLDPLVQESLQEIAQFEFGRMIGTKGYSDIELTVAMSVDEAREIISKSGLTPADAEKVFLDWNLTQRITKEVKANNGLPNEKKKTVEQIENEVVEELRKETAEDLANQFYIEQIAGKLSVDKNIAGFVYNMGVLSDNTDSLFQDAGIKRVLSTAITDVSKMVHKAIGIPNNETINEAEVKDIISKIAIDFMGKESEDSTHIQSDFTGEAEFRIRKNTKSPEKVNVLGLVVNDGKQMFLVDGIVQRLVSPEQLYTIKNKANLSLDTFVNKIQDNFGITIDKNSKEYLNLVKTYRVVSTSKPIIRKLLDGSGEIVNYPAINEFLVKRSDEFAPPSYIDELIQVFGIGGKDTENPGGLIHVKGFKGNEGEISIHDAIKENLITGGKVIYNAFKNNLVLYGGVKANDELLFGLPLIDRSNRINIKKQKLEVSNIINMLRKEVWNKEDSIEFDKEKAKFVQDLSGEEHKGRFKDDWTIEEIYDFSTANHVKFLMKFNQIDDMPNFIQHINDGHILYKSSELNKRMQVFSTKAPKFSSTWVNNKGLNPDTNNGVKFVILNSVNSDGSAHFPNQEAPSYKYIDENGVEKVALYKARYDGGTIVRNDIFDAMAEYFGFDKSVGSIKGIQIGSDKDELGFIGKLAFHRADPLLNANLTQNKIHLVHFDSTAKQKGNRTSYDWEFRDGKIYGKTLEKGKISTLPWESIMAFKAEIPEQVNGFTRFYKQLMTNVNPNTELGRNLSIAIGKEIGMRVQGDALELAKLDAILAKVKTDGEIPKHLKELDTIDIDKLGITRLADIIDKGGSTHLWKRIISDMFNISKESLESSNDAITEPSLDAFTKDMQANEGLAKRIISSSQITKDTLKLPGVNKYVEATLKRYFVAHVLSPKIKHATTATFTPAGMEISKIIQAGEYYLGEGFRKLNVLTDKNGKEVTLEEVMANPEKYDIPLDDALKNKNGLDATIQFKNSDVASALADKPTQPATIIREGVKEYFDSKPELAKIGTQEQYSQHLNTIFPDSTEQNIVYHGNNRGRIFEKFLERDHRISRSPHGPNDLGSGHYFSTSLKSTTPGELYSVKINVKNPYTENTGNWQNSRKGRGSQDLIDKGYDASTEAVKGHSRHYSVFSSEAIHILGGKQDIEGFKKFVQSSAGNKVTLGDAAHKNFYIGDGVYIMPNNKNQKIYIIHEGETNVDGKIVHTYSVSKPKVNFKQLVARGPIDSASAARILKFKGFSGIAGYGLTVHDEEYMGMSGADNDIDTAAVYFGFNNKNLYKSYIDFHSDPQVKNQFHKINANGERVFIAPKQNANLLDSKNKKWMVPFSPMSQIEANKYAYEGNTLLGQGLTYINSMIDLFDSIPRDTSGRKMLIGEKDSEAVGKKRYDNSWSAEIVVTREYLEKLKRDIIQYAADSADGNRLRDIKDIRSMVKDEMFSIKHLNLKGKQVNLNNFLPSNETTFYSEEAGRDITFEPFNLKWNKEFSAIQQYSQLLTKKLEINRKYNFTELLLQLKKLDMEFSNVQLSPYASALRDIGRGIKYKEAVISDIINNPNDSGKDFFALLNTEFPNYMTEKDGMAIIDAMFRLANGGSNKELRILFKEKGLTNKNINSLVLLAKDLKRFAGRQQIIVTPKNLNQFTDVKTKGELAPYETLYQKAIQDIMDVTSSITTYKYGNAFYKMLREKGFDEKTTNSYIDNIQTAVESMKKKLHKARSYDKESRAIGQKFETLEEKQDLTVYDSIEKYKANLKTEEGRNYFDALLISSLDKQALPLQEFLRRNKGRVDKPTVKDLTKEWWSTNFDTTLANLQFVNPKVLREFISSYNGIAEELSRTEIPKAFNRAISNASTDKTDSIFVAINELTGATNSGHKIVNSTNGHKTVENMHSFLNRMEDILKENKADLSPDLVILKNELRDILVKYPQVVDNIENFYLGFTETRSGLAKALSTATKADLIAFKDHLSTLNERGGLLLQKIDYWLSPDALMRKFEKYDIAMYSRVAKIQFKSTDENAVSIETASIITPLSRMSRLVKVQNAIDNLITTYIKGINSDIINSPVTAVVATLNKQANIGTQVHSLSVLTRMLTDKSASPLRIASLEKNRNKFLVELAGQLDKQFVIKDADGKEVIMSTRQIVEFINKEYDKVFSGSWDKYIDGGPLQAQLEKDGLEIDGWIDYKTVIDKFGGLLVGGDYTALEELGINDRFIQKILHTKQVFEMRFNVATGEGTRPIRALDIMGSNPRDTLMRRVKFINQMIKENPEDEYLTLKLTEKIADGYFPIIGQSMKELKNKFEAKILALKKEYKEESKTNSVSSVHILTKIIKTLQDYHFKIGNFGLTDDSIVEMVRSFVDIKDMDQGGIRGIISSVPLHLKGRSQEEGLTIFDTSINAVSSYEQSLVKSNLKRLSSLIMDSQITKFESETLEGKNFVGKENAIPWANFMRLSARDFLGYPSLTPEVWKTDPKMKIQGNPYRFFTDDYWLEKYKSISKAIGIKESELPDFITDPMKINKLVWLSNLDAKWSLASLLFSPKQALSNILGASQNTLSLAGWKYFKQANDIGFLTTINKEWTSWDKVMTDLEKHGAFEAYLSAELNLATRVTGENWQNFLNRALMKIKNDPSVEDTTLQEIARQEGVSDDIWNKSAFFMRKSERFIRARTWLSFYLKWREVLDINKHTTTWDDPWLIKLANEGVYSTQFLYNTASKSAAMRTSVGKVLTRFQQWALKSVELRNELVKNAKEYGYNENSEEYTRFRNLITTDMFIVGLASIFPMSLFSASTPPPISYMKDLSVWVFGDREDKEKAFYGILPYPANIIKPILPPTSRFITDTFSLMSGDVDRFLSTQVWTWFPFGRFARDTKKTFDNPALFGERMLGVPMLTLAKYTSNVRKGKYPEKPRASLSFGEESLDIPEETKEIGTYQAYGAPKKKLGS